MEDLETDSIEDLQDDEAVPICECCLNPYPRDYALFCPKCGTPVDSLALYLPYERILAEGFFLRRAVERPTRLITVIGIWLLALNPGGILVIQIVTGLWEPIGILRWKDFFGLIGGIFVIVFYWAIALRCTGAYLRFRRAMPRQAKGPSGEGPSQEI